MKIVGKYSIKKGEEIIMKNFKKEFFEIEKIITSIKADKLKIKKSKEKTMPGKMLYSPIALNKAFKKEFLKLGWKMVREKCVYPKQYYIKNYLSDNVSKGAFREMDFVKNKLGIEVQFGKYAFMVYNVSAKMTIFHKLGHIDVGVEIVPVKKIASQMSTGVSYFEQFIWDLEKRGVSNIDIPVLVLGLDI